MRVSPCKDCLKARVYVNLRSKDFSLLTVIRDSLLSSSQTVESQAEDNDTWYSICFSLTTKCYRTWTYCSPRDCFHGSGDGEVRVKTPKPIRAYISVNDVAFGSTSREKSEVSRLSWK